MPSLHRKLRQQMPSLTAPIVGDDESADLFDRIRLPRPRRTMEVRTGELEGFGEDDPVQSALPAIFRRKPPPQQWMESPAEVPNIAAPPIAPPTPAADLNIATADRVPVDENAPLPPLRDEDRIVSTPPSRNLLSPETLAEIGVPPMVRRDKSGKPQRQYIGEGTPDERAQVYNEAVHGYEPQESKGWRKWLPLALRGALAGFGAGGVGGALAGGLYGGVSGAINPKLKNEQWKQREMAKSDAEIGKIGQRRKLERADAKAEADLALVNERTKALRNPKPQAGQVRETADGYALIDPVNGTARPVVDAKGNQLRKKLEVGEDLTPDPSDPTILHKTKDGKPTGVTYKIVPGYGNVPSGQAYNADATRTNQVGAATTANQGIEQQIASINDELSRMGPSPPTQTDDVNEIGDVIGKKVNPAYTEWATRHRQLSDEKRRLEGQRKYVPSTGSPPKVSSGRAKVKSKYADRLLSELGIQ